MYVIGVPLNDDLNFYVYCKLFVYTFIYLYKTLVVIERTLKPFTKRWFYERNSIEFPLINI